MMSSPNIRNGGRRREFALRPSRIRIPLVTVCMLITGVQLLTAESAVANPLFARQFNTSCFACHTSPPLLNEFGRRFQANGYQLPVTSDKTSQAARTAFPLGLIVTPMVTSSRTHDNLLDTNTAISTSFAGIMMRFFTSGSLGSHFSYYAGVPVTVANGETTIDIETIQMLCTDVLGDSRGALNFRMGKFLLFVPFTPMFLLSGDDPLVYNSMHYNPIGDRSTANDLNLWEPMFGASAFGTLYPIAQGLRWEVGMTGGNKSDIHMGTARAVFGSLDQTVYLQNAPARIGAFYFNGFQDVSNSAPTAASSMPGMPGMGGGSSGDLVNPWKNNVTRYGFDAELIDPWTKRFDFFAQYMSGTDDNIDSLGTKYQMNGGFVGVNVTVAAERLYAYGRYDWISRNTGKEDQHAIDVGIRYHFLPNVILTAGATISSEVLGLTGLQAPVDQTTTTIRGGFLFGF